MSRPEDIPEDIRKIALSLQLYPVADGDTAYLPSEDYDTIARAILAERRRAKAEERERCARLGEQGYDRPVGTPYRSDGVRSKNDQCPHGRYQYEDCERCYAAAIRKGGEDA